MVAQFVVRLLGQSDELLAWTRVDAASKPQERGGSCPFWPVAQTKFAVEQDGVVTRLSVHWADLDVARVSSLPETPVTAGQVFDFTWVEPVWLVPGSRGVPLPQVTERRNVALGVPSGGIGVRHG